MKKVFISIIIFAFVGILVGMVIAGNRGSHHEVPFPPSGTDHTQPEQGIGERTKIPGIPKTLSIPSLNIVDVPVEEVGLDSENRMDVPSNFYNTGWYKYGPRPGEQGNAAIDGHLDTPTGAPSVFYNIKTLTPGETIIVTDENGEKFTFAVTDVKTYKTEDFPLDEVFGEHPKARLNLITCEGVFDHATRNYSDRVVVYSELKH